MDWERLTGTHSVSPVSEVSPYTHRDAVTHLEEIKSLSRWAHDEIERLETAMKSADSALGNELASFKVATANKFKDLEFKLTEMFKDARNEGLAFDPTNGTSTESVSTVVSRMYDNLRIFGLFAKECDDKGMTAKEWDAWMNKNSARHYDLAFTFPRLNDVMK